MASEAVGNSGFFSEGQVKSPWEKGNLESLEVVLKVLLEQLHEVG